MVNLNNNYLYAKGTCNVVVRNIVSGNVDYQSDKVQTNQFTTTCDMGAIQAGIGNPTAIQIPHNSAVNLTLTNADFNMAARAMQVGGSLAYNGIAPVYEVKTAESAVLTVSEIPAAPYGYTTAICNVVEAGTANAAGTAYTIDTGTKEIQNFAATVGKDYIVTYFKQEASAQYFDIAAMFTPAIKHVTVQITIYSTAGTSSVTQGTKVGDLYIIIPRMQFGAKADTEGSQTTPATTDLSGTALSYNAAAAVGVCTDCAISNLARVMFVPLAGTTSAVKGLAVVGGAVTMAASTTKQTPVMYVMADNTLVQPNYADLTYTIPSAGQTYATVSNTGFITATTAGDTTMTISLASPALTCVADLSVTA